MLNFFFRNQNLLTLQRLSLSHTPGTRSKIMTEHVTKKIFQLSWHSSRCLYASLGKNAKSSYECFAYALINSCDSMEQRYTMLYETKRKCQRAGSPKTTSNSSVKERMGCSRDSQRSGIIALFCCLSAYGRHSLGWSCQKPQRRAREQNQEEVKQW